MGFSRSAVKFDKGQRWIAGLLFVMLLLNYLDRQVLSIVFFEMKKDLGFTQWQYTAATNAFLTAYALMYVGSGLVLDRIGARYGVALFVLLWSLVSALHGLVGGFTGLLVLRFLLGVTEPGGWTGAIKTVSERFTAPQRGLANAIFTSGAGAGALIAPPALVFLTQYYGWRSAFILTGICGLLWLPFWWRASAAPSKAMVETAAAPKPTGIPLWELLRNRRALAFAATRFFGDSTGYFLMFWLPQHLMQNKKFSFVLLGLVGWIPYLIKDVAAIFGGYLSSRMVAAGKPAVYSRKIMMSIAAVLVAGGAAAEHYDHPVLIFLCLLLTSFGMGMWSGNFHSIPGDAFPHRVVATVHGMAGSCGAVGGVLFNTLVGYLMVTGQVWGIFFTLALLMPLGVLPLWLWVREDYVPENPGPPDPSTKLDTAVLSSTGSPEVSRILKTED
jgi:MFS transporter, ACS family, hexuronate transporter